MYRISERILKTGKHRLQPGGNFFWVLCDTYIVDPMVAVRMHADRKSSTVINLRVNSSTISSASTAITLVRHLQQITTYSTDFELHKGLKMYLKQLATFPGFQTK